MKQNNVTEQAPQRVELSEKGRTALDALRAAFMGNVVKHCLEALLEHERLPGDMNRNIVRESKGQLERFMREVRRTRDSQHAKTYFDCNVKPEKMYGLFSLIDLVSRIGVENNLIMYDEFFSMVVECPDEILYAQSKRKNIHFGKYRGMFRLFTEELHRDVNHEPSQFVYHQGELFIKPSPVKVKEELKCTKPK